MDHNIKDRAMLLLLDGGRLISMGILQQQHPDIDESLSDDKTHSKVRQLRNSGIISDEHFHLMFPPTNLSQWDAISTSAFLKHCTDLKEPQRKLMDELHELRNKTMEMYDQQEMSNEEFTSEWETIVRFLEKGKTLLNGPLDVEINKRINKIKRGQVTLEDMDRVKSWDEFDSKDIDTGYEDATEDRSLVDDAAYHGKLFTLKYMSQKFPDRLQERDKDGNEAVHFAAEGGLRFIFESFPDLQMARNEYGLNALHCAANGGSVDCLTYLIGQGMDTDTRTKAGETLLHIAVFGGPLQMVKYVNETCPGLQGERNMKGQDALYKAARGGNLDCLKYLIDQGMDINTRSKYENTLLHAAANGGHVQMVKYILETFPNTKNETDVKGMDALFSAVRGEGAECLTYLVGQDMKMDTRSKYGSAILHEAAFRGSLSMVQYTFAEHFLI